MFEKGVSEIYEGLIEKEAVKHVNNAYPIHKKLQFSENYPDLFHFLEQQMDIPENGNVLDVGCGVGYGTFHLAKANSAHFKGISLSHSEVKLANAIAKKKGLEEKCEFTVQSFNEPLTSNYYQLIFCVESIKHSENIALTMSNLLQSLAVGGKLFIVEDFFAEEAKDSSKQAQQLIQDWHLAQLFTKKQYEPAEAIKFDFDLNYTDLSHNYSPRPLWKAAVLAKLCSLKALFSKRKRYYKIMRGGFALEQLYQKKEMTYEVLEIHRKQ